MTKQAFVLLKIVMHVISKKGKKSCMANFKLTKILPKQKICHKLISRIM